MRNKTMLLVLASSLLCGGAAFAQSADNTTGTTAAATTQEHQGKRFENKLGLTDDQKKQMKDLRASAHDQAAIIRADKSLTDEQKQAKLKELRQSTKQKMNAVLTPEQQQKVAQFREARKDRMKEKLGLTDDQQAKLKEVFQSSHQQRQAILNDTSKSNEQKQADLKALRDNTQAQLKTILSPEQLEKMQHMRRGHKGGRIGA